MDFTRALTYPFDDPDWMTKLGIAAGIAILLIIPLIGTIPAILLLAGFSYEIARRVRNGDPSPLPQWDFGGMLSRGVSLVVPAFLYQIPAFIFLCIALLPVFLPLLGGDNSDATTALGGIGTIGTICCYCATLLYSLAAGIVYLGGYMRYFDNEQMGTFFQVGDNIALVRNNIGDFGQALLLIIVGNIVIGFLGVVPIVGGLAAIALQQAYDGHMLGQLAQKLHAGMASPAV